MEIDGHIDQDYFLEALQDGGTFSMDYKAFYGRPDAIPAKNDVEAVNRSLARFISGRYAAPETGAELVSSLLRFYTDEWLETGIDAHGKESPFSRKISGAQTAFAVVRKYDSRLGLTRVDWDDGLKRFPVSLADRLRTDVVGEGSAITVQPAISSFSARRPAASATPEWLKEHWKAKEAGRKAKEIQSVPEHPNMPRNVVSAASHRAAILFHALMKAPWRYRVGKCRRCQSYFVLKVNPSKSPYVRGMHCPNCKSIASAEASGKTKRAEREQQLLSLAASVWPSWHPTPQFGERSDWVARQVSKLIGEKKAIQRNWVTRHEKEIEALQRKNRQGTNDSSPEALTGQINRFRGSTQRLRRGNALA